MTKISSKQKPQRTHHSTGSDSTLQDNANMKARKHKEILPPGKGLAKTESEAAEYIVQMLVVLSNMAKDVDLKFLNYLLEMAYEESLSHVDKASVAKSSSARP